MRRLPLLLPLLLLLLALPALGQVDATLVTNLDRLNGTHNGSGRILLNAPNPAQPGSSISHWDPSPIPNLLMEPALNADLGFLDLDISPGQMQDIGWQEGNANVSIFDFSEPGSGFLDPRPFAGAPGNDATTLGEARQNLFAAVVGTWGNALGSDVDIDIAVFWQSLPCTPGVGAVLGAAGTLFIFNDPSFPLADTWYHSALAESFAGQDLTGPPVVADGNITGGDIIVFINDAIDNECLAPGTGWYYGLDANAPPNLFALAPVVLHELGHGLGFANFTNEVTGQLVQDLPSIYDVFTLDETTGKTWDEMSDDERATSAVNTLQVSWTGAEANLQAADVLMPGVPELVIAGPPEVAGTYEAAGAAFGPPVPDGGLAGEIACMTDVVDLNLGDFFALNGCLPATNPDEVAGKIALIDRGACAFTTKVANAQAAGAIGAVIVNNRGGTPVFMGGADPSITIPVVSVGNFDGNRIRQAACPESAALLGGDRFAVAAHWWTEDDEGEGQAGMLGETTAYFSFFEEDNVEVTVKVLDACNAAGFNNFWVFAGGMTDVEVLLTVTDTATGQARAYYNPLHTAFGPIQDTEAFSTCP